MCTTNLQMNLVHSHSQTIFDMICLCWFSVHLLSLEEAHCLVPVLRMIVSTYFSFSRLSKFLISRSQINGESGAKNGRNGLSLILGFAYIYLSFNNTVMFKYKASDVKTHYFLIALTHSLQENTHPNEGKIIWAFPKQDYFLGQTYPCLEPVQVHAIS